MTNSKWEKEIQRISGVPMYWHNKADNLHASAAILWASYDDKFKKEISSFLNCSKEYDIKISTFPVYVMLCGLALELSLKSILAFKKNVTSGHKLDSLIMKCEIPVNENEIGILKIYSEYVFWVGKYPIPLNSEAFEKFSSLNKKYASKEENLGNSKFKVIKGIPIFEWENFNNLYNKITGSFWDLHNKENSI